MAFIFREAWRSIRNAPMTWAMSAVTLAVALTVSALFVGAAITARTSLREARESLPIEAFFEPNVSDGDARAIVLQEFRSFNGVRSVTFTTHAQALEDFKHASGEDIEHILGTNPLPASATIRLIDPTANQLQQTIDKLKSIGGVADVRGDIDLLHMLEDRSNLLERVAIILGSLLILTSVFFLILAARLTMLSRRETVHVMKQLGASQAQVVMPVSMEGAVSGLLAGIVAFLLMLLLVKTSGNMLAGFIMVPSAHEYPLLAAEILGAGLVLGMLPTTAVAWAVGRKIN
jgi:cell division transport system permease protein